LGDSGELHSTAPGACTPQTSLELGNFPLELLPQFSFPLPDTEVVGWSAYAATTLGQFGGLPQAFGPLPIQEVTELPATSGPVEDFVLSPFEPQTDVSG
jgi:hypothetical protein